MQLITTGIARAVISNDLESTRFETFCNAIISNLEGGAIVLSTSRSWDRGRDGRGIGPASGIYTCCSLNDYVEDKAERDLERLTSTTQNIKRVYFCSSQTLSEHQADGIKAQLVKMLPDEASVEILGCAQLAEISEKDSAVLYANYRAEIDDCLAALKGPDASLEADTLGLRLALSTAGHDDSAEIRKQLYNSCIRTVLTDGAARTVNELCRDISAALRLQRNLAPEAISSHLEDLRTANEIEHDGVRFRLTEAGASVVAEHDASAAERLISGRHIIRQALEKSIGSHLLDDHYNNIWKIIQDNLAHVFYTQGNKMLDAVSALLEHDKKAEKHPSPSQPPFFLDKLADAVAATSSLESQRLELRTVIMDMFSDPHGEAFDWLVRLCAAFVALCSLGLEATSGKEIANLVSRMSLVPDTDVILSLLSEGEPYHEAVVSLVRRWRALGGQVLMADPVLHEVAHHAYIADNDYQEVKHWLPGSKEERLHIIDNAFVRGFAHLLDIKEARPQHWRRYISQFVGKDRRDHSKIAAILRDDYKFTELLQRSRGEEELENTVRGYLIERAHATYEGRQVQIAIDKAKRDARLYSSIVRHHRALRNKDSSSGCFLVSSARRLVDVEKKYGGVGEPNMVVPIPTVLYLLSLVPGVSIGLTPMAAFLFGERSFRFSSELERTLIRVIHDSKEFAVPWAKRVLLIREIRTRLLDDAKKAGIRVNSDAQKSEVEHSAITKKALPRTIEIMRDSLDAVVAESHLEQENRELRKQVEALRRQLASSQTQQTKQRLH